MLRINSKRFLGFSDFLVPENILEGAGKLSLCIMGYNNSLGPCYRLLKTHSCQAHEHREDGTHSLSFQLARLLRPTLVGGERDVVRLEIATESDMDD